MVTKPPRDPNYTMHTEAHALAKDISEYCEEPKKFAMYLGALKRIGISRGYQLFSMMKDPTTNAKQPGRWFMAMTRRIDPKVKK
jgi:hypothetical protein